jgi:outer membrane receptor protein involved in Fe transport
VWRQAARGLRRRPQQRADVFASWRHSERLRFDFRVENFTDKRFLRGSQSGALVLMPGVPRTFRGELSLSF